MNDINVTLISKFIKNRRLEKGLSQAQLEKLSGIPCSTISTIERANYESPYNMSIAAIIKISHALKTTFADVLKMSGFLAQIEDEKFNDRTSTCITNHDLINLFNRLPLQEQKLFVQTLITNVESYETAKQKEKFSKHQ